MPRRPHRWMFPAALTPTLIIIAAGVYAADTHNRATPSAQQQHTRPAQPNQQAQQQPVQQTTAAQPSADAQGSTHFQPRLQRANRLLGSKVVNRQNEELGRIEDIVIAPEGNRISYAVLSFGGWMGVGDKLFAVPWQAMQVDAANNRLILDSDKQALRDAPGFDKNRWPDMADGSFTRGVDRFYNGQRDDRTRLDESRNAQQFDRQPRDRQDVYGNIRDERRDDDRAYDRRYEDGRGAYDRPMQDPRDRRMESAPVDRQGSVFSDYDQARQRRGQSVYDRYYRDEPSERYDDRSAGAGYPMRSTEAYDRRFDERRIESRDAQGQIYAESGDGRAPEAQQPQRRGWQMPWSRNADDPRRQEMQARRLSKVIGTEVRNFQGEDVGNIEDIVVDTTEGRVVYAVVSLGGWMGTGVNEKLVAVPWTAVEMRPALNAARLDADKQSLEVLAFDENAWPNLADRSYARRVHEQFDQQPYWEVYGYTRDEARDPASAWAPGSEFLSSYNPAKTATIEGVIESVGTFQPSGNAAEGIRLRVKSKDNRTLTVLAGPQAYADKNNINFYYGDPVKITGSQSQWDGRNVLIASQITKGNQTLNLLDSSGRPQWRDSDLRFTGDQGRFDSTRGDRQPSDARDRRDERENDRGFFDRLRDRFRD